MNLKSYINEVNTNIAAFIAANYPDITAYAERLGQYLNNDGAQFIIWVDQLKYADNGAYLSWRVQVAIPSGINLNALDVLKEFMKTFMYKPIVDPECQADDVHEGTYETGANDMFDFQYARCWVFPNFPEGITESHVL